jgi:hypothetical protein
MYQPKNMPEITVHYDYSQAEYERGYQAVPADVEIEFILINGFSVSDALEEHLIETFGDIWTREIINGQRQRRLVGAV